MGNLYKFGVYLLLTISKLFVLMYFFKANVNKFSELGTKTPPFTFYGFYLYFLELFISFISMSYAFLTHNFLFIFIYFIFTFTITITSVIILPYVSHHTIFTLFTIIQLFELIFVYVNFEEFCSKALFQKNKRIGSRIEIKKALNVSKI